MFVGDKKTFAIQYSLDDNFGGKWLFGKLAFWINDDRIGDFEAGTSLADCLGFITGILKYNGRRSAASLCDLSPGFVFDLLENAIFREEDTELLKYLSNSFAIEMLGSLLLTPLVDIFDHCRAYTFECDDYEKIIYKESFDKQAKSIAVPKGCLAATTKPFYDWLNRLYDLHAQK